jgi:hypothetical protein
MAHSRVTRTLGVAKRVLLVLILGVPHPSVLRVQAVCFSRTLPKLATIDAELAASGVAVSNTFPMLPKLVSNIAPSIP